MTKGGARARSGPAPDPTAFRRERDAGDWTILPAEGRQGATPEWPLTDQTFRENELWQKLWLRPQALMWERYGQDTEVALYVRRLTEAEMMNTPVNLTTLVRQMADSLGLTSPGMRANRWRIDRLEDTREQPSSTVTPIAPNSARERLKAISGGSS